jgi:hypothetical protein
VKSKLSERIQVYVDTKVEKNFCTLQYHLRFEGINQDISTRVNIGVLHNTSSFGCVFLFLDVQNRIPIPTTFCRIVYISKKVKLSL